jgi:signal transduction histidine kinase
MSWRSVAITLGGMVLAAAAVLWLFERQLSSAWFRLGMQPEVITALERSLDDRKALARLDPTNTAEYRRRFDEDQALLNRLRILEHNRKEIVRRYEMILLAVVGSVLVVAGVAYLARQGRRDRRFEERDRRRLAALQNLSMWQETARRHAHEMKTPLTAARLELTRLRETVHEGEARQAVDSVDEELDRLGRFTRDLTSFARLPSPRLEVHDLGATVAEFASTFARAWPLDLDFTPPGRALHAAVDRELIRQALVNLCDNAAQAGARRIRLRLAAAGPRISLVPLDVADDGPGIAPEVRGRVFEPYVTTRKMGEGMGLGLAISKKILLDHGGDLDMVETSEAGTVFRMVLPRSEGER